jgi:hypothetical protein
MPTRQPIAASGSREPKKQATVPKKVRDAIKIMVRGRPDDEAAKPVDFVEAAKLADVNSWVVRQWLDRVEGRAFLKAERRAFRDAVCAGNELALKRVRDTSENGMAIIGSVRALEQIDEEAQVHGRGGVQQTPGLIINIINAPGAQPRTIPGTPAPVTIEHQADEGEPPEAA